MIKHVTNPREAIAVATWVSQKIFEEQGLTDPVRPPFTAFVILRDESIEAAALLLGIDLKYRDCILAAAVERPSLEIPALFRRAFDYAFLELGLARVSAPVVESSHRSERLAKALGFQIEGTLREAGPDRQNLLMLGLLPTDRRV